MNLAAIILSRALANPDAPAIATVGGVATYGELAAGVLGCASRLDKLGLGPGSVIAINTGDVRVHIALILAAELRGVTSASVQSIATLHASKLRVDAIFADSVFKADGASIELVDESWLAPPQGIDISDREPASFDDGAGISRIVLSSGTTGAPKAIGISAAKAQARAFQFMFRHGHISETDRHLSMMGISTIGGDRMMACALLSGACLVYANGPRDVLKLIRGFQVSVLMGSPAHFQGLLQAGAARGVYPSLRRVIMGGSRVQAGMVQLTQSVFTNTVHVGYGSTEVGPMAGGLPHVLRGQDGAVGRVAPWARVDILDENERPVAAGCEGVVRIKSSVMGRYLNADAGNCIRGEYFYPGDVGFMREDGVLVITGRTDDLINAGGAKIAPELLEDVLLAHPAVRDAAVFAAPGPHGADRVYAAIVRSGDVSEADLLAHCREQISQGAPVAIEWIDAVPRNENGKVVRHALRARFTQKPN